MERDGVFPNGIPKNCNCLITGVGILSSAINLSKIFQEKPYEHAIQIGIAGAYRSSRLNIGDIVEVETDFMPEFSPWEPNVFSATGSFGLERVKGASVLNCTKTEETGKERGNFAQIETMEGAAFFAVCKEYGVQAVQVRAISNYAGLYNKNEWKIKEALSKLKDFFSNFTSDASFCR